MAIGIQRVAESANIVAEQSQTTVSEARQGEKAIEAAVNQMDLINISVKKLASTISLLGEKSQQIDEILKVITTISDQTNLLALNAAIEAARAGEHGKGFAVVADEVRKLAEQSQASAKKITELIREIQTDTDQTLEAMKVGTKDVESGLTLVHNTGATFKNILAASEKVAAQIEEMSSVAEQISASTEQVTASVEEMAIIAATNANGTHVISVSADEQVKSLKEITLVSDALKSMAVELEQLISKFNHHH
ncbi:methyl-accepting chemotaxis protein [Bacillus sp. Marseille-P3661]|uniref:methyl-accepting chemotaxis protein n=1 Tax=Bacillus sp. Marseille-P3661 TaxID=1936234 RepID=UPI0035B53CA8